MQFSIKTLCFKEKMLKLVQHDGTLLIGYWYKLFNPSYKISLHTVQEP
jgi:hypothetical protein